MPYGSLVPRPQPSFSLLAVQESGESLVSFSQEHDVVQNQKVLRKRSTNYSYIRCLVCMTVIPH